jgi:septal ring factor EnvC (AmiA/AmiB activator)
MLLNQQNPYAVGRLNNYYDYFSNAQEHKLALIRDQISTLEKLRTRKKQNVFDLQKQQATQAEQEQALEGAREERQTLVKKLDTKVLSSEQKLKKLRQDRAGLNLLIKKIAVQAERLRKLERERIEAENRNRKEGSAANKTIRPIVKGGFLKQRGRLRYPAKGDLKNRFGSRIPESGMKSQGVFIDTHGAKTVNSIYSGRVLFADHLKGYGLLLIVDHGDDHISLYGHNGLLYKQVGDRIETGETIALSGVSGGLKTAGLYFEIRQGATPVDPAKWCQ